MHEKKDFHLSLSARMTSFEPEIQINTLGNYDNDEADNLGGFPTKVKRRL
jgi:hypothetical protein